MKKILLMSILVLTASLALVVPADSIASEEAEAPAKFDKYYMVFLMRPEKPADYGEARNAELQREHIGHLTWLWKEGYALVAGPFGGDKDDDMRGIVLLRGDLEMERARELAEMDPRVKAGQLRVDIREWYTGAGAMEFPLEPEEDTPEEQAE